jgi:putative acetyltransferase
MLPIRIDIRPEEAADIPAIYAVNEQAFGGSYEAKLVDLLRAADKATISLIAEHEGQIVGHILFSPVTLTPPRPDLKLLGLAPLAVLPAFQNQGIGAQLTLAGLAACHQQNYDAVVVLGHPTYYPRFGFGIAREHNLGNEYGADEAFMVLELRKGTLVGAAGVVQYAPEFGEADA